jgi:hypothetical protein
MTPEEKRLLKFSVVAVTGVLRDDSIGLDRAFRSAGSDISPVIDGTYLLAISLASILGVERKEPSVERVLRGLKPAEVEILPASSVNWEIGIQIAAGKSLADGHGTGSRSSGHP